MLHPFWKVLLRWDLTKKIPTPVKFCTRVRDVLYRGDTKFPKFIWGCAPVQPSKHWYCYVHLQNKLTHGDHRSFSFGVAVEDKSLQHNPQVCSMNVLKIMSSNWACVEITCGVPFLKSYKPVTEAANFSQKAITFEKGHITCNFYAY
jgi:hypothetical protein